MVGIQYFFSIYTRDSVPLIVLAIFVLLIQNNSAEGRPLSRTKNIVAPSQGNLEYQMSLGLRYFRRSEFQKAVSTYTTILKTHPKSFEGHVLRADAYGRLYQFNEQIKDLSVAIQLSPERPDLYVKRVKAYYQLKLIQSALCDLDLVKKLGLPSYESYRIAANAYEELGLYGKAVECRTHLIAMKTGRVMQLRLRAKDYELLGQLELARKDRQDAANSAKASEKYDTQLCSPLVDLEKPTLSSSADIVDKQLNAGSVILPFHYDQYGAICIPVQANGNALELMLDTGCQHTSLWRKALPLVYNGSRIQETSTLNGENYKSRFLRVRELKLGDLVLPHMPIEIVSGLEENTILSGFLGGNILENLVLTIDYSKKEVVFASAFDSHDLKKALVVPMIVRDHRPYCDIRLNGNLNLVALVDTGSTANIASDYSLKSILPKKFDFTDVVSGPSIIAPIAYLKLSGLEIGTKSFESPIFAIFSKKGSPDFTTEPVIGNTFLSKFNRVTFDYPGRKLIFEYDSENSQSALGFMEQGRFYSGMNERQQAVEAYRKAFNLDKDFVARGRFLMAMEFKQLKEYKNALQELDQAILLDSNNPRLHSERAGIHRILGDYPGLIEDDSALIRLIPSNHMAYRERAWAYSKLGKHNLADRDLRTAERVYRKGFHKLR